MSDLLPLPALFARALATASSALPLPTAADATQELIRAALADLQLLSSRIAALALFSPNERAEDVATRDFVYLLVPFARAELVGRVRAATPVERTEHLMAAQVYIDAFLATLEAYEIVSEAERALHTRGLPPHPAQRRLLKIQQYQAEKELRARIETVHQRRSRRPTPSDTANDFDLIAALLPAPTPTADAADDEDDEDEREAALLLLRLTYAQARAQRASMEQELVLLRSVPPPDELASDGRRGEEDGAWRLDAPARRDEGALLDSSGKPLRPFTILPSSASDRARLQAQVFGPGHRLPTMSIDEYLAVERERGNVITGGGAASAAAPTSGEQLARDAEEDGTRMGEERGEEKRVKDERWAVYTDENPRGAGNTMNRG